MSVLKSTCLPVRSHRSEISDNPEPSSSLVTRHQMILSPRVAQYLKCETDTKFRKIEQGNKTETTYWHKNAEIWNLSSDLGRLLWLNVKKIRSVASQRSLPLWSLCSTAWQIIVLYVFTVLSVWDQIVRFCDSGIEQVIFTSDKLDTFCPIFWQSGNPALGGVLRPTPRQISVATGNFYRS